MDVIWYGRSCFFIKGSELSVLADPVNEGGGLIAGLPTADVATFSQGLLDQPLPPIKPRRRIIRSPGEFEVAGAFVHGAKAFRDRDRGAQRGPTIVFTYVLDGVHVCHLGGIGHVPTTEQASAIGAVDVLLVPVGPEALDSEQASDVVAALEPKAIIPFHTGTAADREVLAKLLKNLSLPQSGPLPKLAVTRSSNEPQRIVLLEPAKG